MKSPAGPTELRCVRHAEPTGRRFGGTGEGEPATGAFLLDQNAPSGSHQPPPSTAEACTTQVWFLIEKTNL